MKRVLLLGLLLCGFGCRPAQDVAAVERSENDAAAEAQADPAEDQPKEGLSELDKPVERTPEEQAAFDRRFNGVELFRRPFAVMAAGKRVGNAVLTLREFQNGTIVRTGLEYWMFRRTDKSIFNREDEYHFVGYASEFADGRPAALWGAGQWRDWFGRFRLQGEGGKLKVTGNRFLHYFNPRTYTPPDGYRLLLALRGQMREAIKQSGPASFEWQRCLWRQEELAWRKYTYVYTGAEEVMSVEGKSHAAHRFDITAEGAEAPTETLWVDDEGLPLRRMVPALNGFEMLVSEVELGEDVSMSPAWDDVKNELGEEEAAKTVMAADIIF